MAMHLHRSAIHMDSMPIQTTEGNTSTEARPDMDAKQIPATRAGAGKRASKWRYLVLMAMVGLLICVGGAYLAYKYQVDLGKWRSLLSNAKPYFVICHWILIACAWIYWPELVNWGLQKKIVRPDEEVEMRSGYVRLKIVGFLVAFELLIVMQVQNVIYANLAGH